MSSRRHSSVFRTFDSQVILIMSFSNDYITVDPNDGTIFLVQTKWWRLSEKYMEIFWMQSDGYDSPFWMTRTEDGHLYPAIIEENRRDFD